MFEILNEKTPCGGAYAKIFYKDIKGQPISRDKACQAHIQEYSKDGELLKETIMLMNGWYPGKEPSINDI